MLPKFYAKPLFITAIALSLAACSSSDSTTNSAAGTAPVNVMVKTQTGNLVTDATVSIGESSATTNANGIATLQLDDLTQRIATVTKAGYMSQTVKVSGSGASVTPQYEATMAPKELAATAVDYSTASTDSPVEVTGDDGSNVTISDNNAWVTKDANGQDVPYTGTVDVYITPIDTTSLDTLEAFPGEFEGVTAAEGETLPIMSWGMADFSFQTADGTPLDLADGVSATIDIPLYQQGANADFDPLVLGETVPLWYYDYDTAQWIEEGTGVVTDVTENGTTTRVVRGTVTHFTPWNIDKARRFGINVTVNVQCEGSPAYTPDSGQVKLILQNGGFTYTGNLGSTGSFNRTAVPFGSYCATGYGIVCDGEQATLSQCLTIPFNNSVFQTTLTARRTNP